MFFFTKGGVSDVPGKLVAGHIPGLAAARSYDDRDLDPLNAASAGIAAAATSGRVTRPLFSAPAASAGPPGGILASAELETLDSACRSAYPSVMQRGRTGACYLRVTRLRRRNSSFIGISGMGPLTGNRPVSRRAAKTANSSRLAQINRGFPDGSHPRTAMRGAITGMRSSS